MVLLQDFFEIIQAEDPEERQIISGVNWDAYETLLNELGDSLQYRVTYLDGILEFVSPNRKHERKSKRDGMLKGNIHFWKKRRLEYASGTPPVNAATQTKSALLRTL